MAAPEWTVLAEAGRARLLEPGEQGELPRLMEELVDPQATPAPGPVKSDEELRRFARQIAGRLEQLYAQARFEYLRIGAEPRLLGPLRQEIGNYLDLPRAVLEWREVDVIPIGIAEAMLQMGTGGSP